ncbi:DoxX family protein [Streptomyces sp. M10]|uniref:DoxX family protein n=1 Tax=Streptomyces sp. M10 TaxID=412968 RepID=UPI0006462FC5|nr:membrane protein [Streptomyces sp. M10]
MAAPSRSALFLSGLLAAAGTAHFVAPRGFDAIAPEALPGDPRRWTRLSGVAEVALAAGVAHPRTRRLAVAHPRTRRLAAGLTGAFFVAAFPANLQMAADWRNRSPVRRAVAYGRLPLQVPLVLWAESVRRGAGRAS